MEVKVEAMEQEVTQLKVKNQQLSDSLRVKEKICDDCNDTISQLKQVQLIGYCYYQSPWLLLGTGYQGSHDPTVKEYSSRRRTRVTATTRGTRINQSRFTCNIIYGEIT